jgi:hypothetical protein
MAGHHPSRRGTWADVDADPAFESAQSAHFAHTHRLEREGVVDLISTWSRIAALETEAREEVLGRVRRLLTDTAYDLAYETRIAWARLGTVSSQ